MFLNQDESVSIANQNEQMVKEMLEIIAKNSILNYQIDLNNILHDHFHVAKVIFFLRRNQYVKDLFLEGNLLGNEGVKLFRNLKLRILRLSGNNLTDDCVKYLLKMKSLEDLYLHNNNTTCRYLHDIIDNLPNLEYLSFSCNEDHKHHYNIDRIPQNRTLTLYKDRKLIYENNVKKILKLNDYQYIYK
jgi:hypothetical protein